MDVSPLDGCCRRAGQGLQLREPGTSEKSPEKVRILTTPSSRSLPAGAAGSKNGESFFFFPLNLDYLCGLVPWV